MFASFHISGKIPRRKDLLNSSETGSAMMMAESLIIFAGRWSGPQDLFGSSEFRILSTSCGVVTIVLRVGTGPLLWGVSVWLGGTERCD